MKLSILARILVSYPLLKFGIIANRIRQYSRDSFLILMYHRVLPRREVNSTIQPGMYVFDTTFKMHLEFLKHHFHVLSLQQLIKDKSYGSNDKPLCAVTFDDGWLDFYHHAYPLLVSFNVPTTVFLPTDFISSNRLFWTDTLAHILENGVRLKLSDNVTEPEVERAIQYINGLKGKYEERLEKAIELLKKFPMEVIERILDEAMHDKDIAHSKFRKSFLNWSQVREMKKSGLVSFGSHTCTHRILTTLGETEISGELERSRAKLLEEKACDESFIPFCYPNGNYNEKILELLKEAQYDLAVTTHNGWNKKGSNPFTLKRIGIHDDMTCTESVFGYRLINLP